ncbi:MAG: hypothetical protein LBU62_09120 [Bacteroidales bacterium]|jgi:hypothetical protein|nr:hypothetical protein [Bacteroidales bacterium]
MKTIKLPEPVIIPGIMQTLRDIKDKISLDIMDMTYEEEREYLASDYSPQGDDNY